MTTATARGRETAPDISHAALDALIDHAAIASARSAFDAAVVARDGLRTELRGPKGATSLALRLDRDLRAAERAADVAHDALTQATAEAAQPIALLGAKLRLDAAARIEAAKAELAAAEAAYDDAGQVFEHARAHGWRPTDHRVMLTQPMKFMSADIHPERPRNGLLAEREMLAQAGLLDPEPPPAVAARKAA